MEVSQEIRDLLVGDAQTPQVEDQAVVDAQPEEELDLVDGQEDTPTESVDAQQDAGESERLNDILDAQEIDKEWFYGRKVTIAGEGDDREDITLSDAINQVQDVRRRESTLSKREQELNAEIRKRATQPQQPMITPELQQAHGQKYALQQQYNAIDSRDDLDPGEKANAKLQIGTAYQQVEGQIQQYEQQYHGQMQQAQQEAMQRRNQVILDKVAEWKDPKVMLSESNAIYEVGRQYGITEQEINSTPDPRMIVMMRKLAQYEAKSNATTKATHKLRKAPRMAASGGRSGITDNTRVDALVKRAKTSGATKRDIHLAEMAIAKKSGLI